MASLLDTFILRDKILLSVSAVFCLCSLLSLHAHSFSLGGQHVNSTTNWRWVSGELLLLVCAVSLCMCVCVRACPRVLLLFTSVICKVRRSVKTFCVCVSALLCLLCKSVSFCLLSTCVCVGKHVCVCRGYRSCHLFFCLCKLLNKFLILN